MGKTRRPKWFQFRLRTLLIAILVLSLPLSWFAGQLQRATREREAVRIIEDAGGVATTCRCAEQPEHQWKPKFWKDVFHVHVRHVSFSPDGPLPAPGHAPTRFGDDEATYLKRLNNLVSLYLTDTQVTDAGLENLKGLTNLILLSLKNTQVTDAGLEHLKGLTWLNGLSLTGTKITDTGLEHLRGLTKLEKLSLDDTDITDTGLEHLRGLSKLTDLSVMNTKVTPDGVKKLQKALPNCTIDY